MINTALYVFDETCDVERIIRYCRRKDIKRICLSPVTADENIISSVIDSLSSSLDCKLETVPYLERFNELAFLERDNYARLIAEFAKQARFKNGMNIIEYFKYPGRLFSIWWLSLMAEKNPLKSDSFFNLIRTITILRLKNDYRCGHIVLDMEIPELCWAMADNAASGGYICKDLKERRRKRTSLLLLRHFLKGAFHYFYLIYKASVAYIYSRGLGFRRKILEDAEYIAFTYFSSADGESLKENRFINKYYGPLQDVLEEKYKQKFIWFSITYEFDKSTSGFGNKSNLYRRLELWIRNIRLYRKLNSWKYPIYPVEEWLTLKDLVIIAVQYFHTAVKFITKLPDISKGIRYPGDNINIWSIFKEDWLSSFLGTVLMSGLAYCRIFVNISNALKPDATVIYLAENQPWEKALNSIFHTKAGLKLIGIVHSTIPLLYMPYLGFKQELQEKKESRFYMPRPDYLACGGRIPQELLQQAGWDKERLSLWPAVRFQHLNEYIRRKIQWEDRQDKISVVLSVKPKELKEVLLYIHRAFNGKINYQIVLKEHYLFPIRSFISRLNVDFDENIFTIADEGLDRILSSVKAAIVTRSSAALEAIAFGCPVIIPWLVSTADINPLTGISDLAIYVKSPAELRSKADEIIRSKLAPVSHEKCRDFIENYFRFFDSDNELLEEVEKSDAAL